ncbi:hypothetical protein PQC07_gp054 [Aeromonas phage D3]|uniref:Uncharacterized protein n=1 Tax=Aeromonas phage D3 TaxID=2593327 RepID=A0A514TVA3_9CAUD|nr:hypothetical protein PQC07_gp054 [Aeromonas phage D3]QDJ96951.1 hypothetical protein D3_0221 [Aeromonas phage D3]QEP52257.1 hypothetical protein D9_0050 [Aeromonas phage D9]
MKKLESLNFENLINHVYAMGLQLGENIDCAADDKVVDGHVIASVGVHRFVVRNDTWDTFVNVVNNGTTDEFYGMVNSVQVAIRYEVIMESPNDYKVIPVVGTEVKEIPKALEQLLLERTTGLMSICAGAMGRIAKLVNIAQDRNQRNGELVKDFDAMLTFNTELGHGFKPELCFDKIPAILREYEGFHIDRTPFTQELKEQFLTHEYKLIDRELEILHDVVQAFLNSKAVKSMVLAEELAINVVNSALVAPLLDQQITFISFGGVDNWRLTGDLTPNSQKCHDIMDVEIESIMDMLRTLPLEEGVDYWAIDTKTLNVYGRTELNATSEKPHDISEAISLSYCDGLLELLKVRLSMHDNKHVITIN